ncbi:MAG: DUF1211 domain-containing protein [Maricaulaceae bacterium]|nr:DUF1211 domain-containing protein [Maricaulaceae bacterium]
MGRTYKLRGEANFKWRGADVSRVENFSDIVFALVLTLAAVQTVPAAFDDLTGLWRDALALAACFALIMLIWRTHHVYFRRYGLEDGLVTILNAVLLFLVLAYIFPLKFMADFVVRFNTGGFASGAEVAAALSLDQVPWLYVIYGGFYAAVNGVFALLYAHALRRAGALGLDAREGAYTRFEIEQALGIIALTAVIVILAFSLPVFIAPFVGILFALIGLVSWLCGQRAEARAKAAEAAEAA